MKSNILVLLAAVAAHAAEFSTGQAARLVIGQRTFTDGNQGADQNLVGGVSGLATGMYGDFTENFTPGHYAFVCFVPDTRDGKPHIEHGMVKEFTVK